MNKIRLVILMLITLLVATTAQTQPIKINGIESTKTIDILGTSDVHGHFYPWDYARDEEYSSGSLAQVASIAKEVRAQNPATFMLDNGDLIQGNSAQLFTNRENPLIKSLNEIGYDTFNTGNHEYNFGMSNLNDIKRQFNGSFLVGNVYNPDGTRLGNNYSIIDRDGVKIAVIGMVTPHITKWDGPNLAGYNVTDPYAEIDQSIKEIQNNNEDRSDDLADVIVVSFHAGFDGEYGNDSAVDVANKFPEVDMVLAGHAHEKRIERHNNAVVIEPGKYAEQVARVNMKLTYDTTTKHYEVAREEDVKATLIETKEYNSDKQFLDNLSSFDSEAKEDARKIIGTLSGETSLVGYKDIKGIPDAQVRDSALIDLILNVQRTNAEKAIPENSHHIVSTALFQSNADIYPGEIKKADASVIYPYENTLMTIKTSGEAFKLYIETNANYYNQIEYDDLTISFNENIRGYNYDMFSGVDYEIDISKPVGQRVTNLVYSDSKVDLKNDDEVYVTVNNYRGNSSLLNEESGLWKDFPTSVVYDSVNDQISQVRDMIVNYISDKQVITNEVDNNWTITGVDFNQLTHQTLRNVINDDYLSVPTSIDGRTPNVASITKTELDTVLNTKLSFADKDYLRDESNASAGQVITKLLSTSENPIVLLDTSILQDDFRQGTITYETIYDMLPIDYVFSTKSMTGLELQSYFEINPEINFSGLKVIFEVTNGQSKKVKEIIDLTTGKAIDMNKTYLVLTEDGETMPTQRSAVISLRKTIIERLKDTPDMSQIKVDAQREFENKETEPPTEPSAGTDSVEPEQSTPQESINEQSTSPILPNTGQ